jgi:glycosyltransferase involved in cell wall biosynthesis
MARSSAALCRALVRRGHDVTVATARLDRTSPREESLGGVRVRRFPGPALLQRWLVPWGRGLGTFLRAELPGFDVVHLHGHRNGFAVTASRTLQAAERACVLSTHGTFPRHAQFPVVKALFDQLAGAAIVRRAALLLAVSESEARDLPRPARVIPNGVEPCGAASRERGRDRARLLFVGTGRPQKRGHVLPALLEALPGAELHLVGSFGERFLRLFAPHLDRVQVRGVLSGDALAEAYASADVVVHPAVGEAFGLVPFEAALAGTAAVVAGGHGCGEWFGKAGGCVVAPDEPDALLEAVRVRLQGSRQAAAEAQAVARFSRAHLTWDQAALAVESLYRDVLGGRA